MPLAVRGHGRPVIIAFLFCSPLKATNSYWLDPNKSMAYSVVNEFRGTCRLYDVFEYTSQGDSSRLNGERSIPQRTSDQLGATESRRKNRGTIYPRAILVHDQEKMDLRR
ncbi:hypothetical protein F5Y11DRAFT_328610 [Daldinia sp. FL1419]|nr:hypothetical protein F5Y11DRAFT_328610 [Daldinia sp. FL1419]